METLKKLFTKSLNIQRNEFVKLGGNVDTNIYLVESGSLKIFVVDEEQEQIIRFAYTGDLLVALDSFLNEKPSDFYIQAIKKTKLKVLPKASFTAFIEQSGEHQKLWTNILEDLILQQIEREKDLLTTSPKKRYESVLQRSPKLFQEIPNKYIANYLRMSPETLSRLKKS